MGSLSDLRLPTAEVEVPGAGVSLTLRGLSLNDASILMRRHGESLGAVYADSFSEGGEAPSMQEMAKTLLQTAPLAVAEIIALANDADDLVSGVGSTKARETAARLPGPVQLEALVQIAALTFHSEEGLGKFLETVISGSGMLTRLVKGLTSPGL